MIYYTILSVLEMQIFVYMHLFDCMKCIVYDLYYISLHLFIYTYTLFYYTLYIHRWTKVNVARQVVINLSIKYPHLIDAYWTKNVGGQNYDPFYTNYTSAYNNYTDTTTNNNNNNNNDNDIYNEANYLKQIKQQKLIKNINIKDIMYKYKYLLVLSGISASERLTPFLAHSGAVILMQVYIFTVYMCVRVRVHNYVYLVYVRGVYVV